MAAVSSRTVLIVALASCGKLQGIAGDASPLATMQVEVTSDPGAAGEHLYVALVWGMQWLPEALCTGLVPETDPTVVAALAAGCRDPFGFVPLRVEANVPIVPGVPATISLIDLPSSDVLVGDITARVAYGSFVVYDDRNGTGNLELARANRIAIAGSDSGSGSGSDTNDTGSNLPVQLPDVVYGASFMTMTAPDLRLAYREGAFVETAFYPRSGCADPPPAFSILGAGGFTAQAGIDAVIAGTLPPEDPATCTEGPAPTTVVPITPTAAMADVEAACTENTADSSVRYREPMANAPDLGERTTACVPVPTLGGSDTGPQQTELIVTGRSDDSCAGLTHYVLKGCRNDPNCALPNWDHIASSADMVAMPAHVNRALVIVALVGLARRAAHADDDGEVKLSLPTESDRAAWTRPGFRLGLGLDYGELVGLRGAPSGRLLGVNMHAGLRLDDDWSLLVSFDYARVSSPAGISGLRFAGTLDPTWHVTRAFSLAFGFGFGGIVEGHTNRPDVDPLPNTLDSQLQLSGARARRYRNAAAAASSGSHAPSTRG